jgi:high-affinity iron transporter
LAAGLSALGLLVVLMATAETGPVDPSELPGRQSDGTVIMNSALIVFREGLEAVLIFAAVTASFLGANRARRRPVVAGAASAFAATVATWFVAQALLDVASPLGPRLEAITGLLAVVVLLFALNWFMHRVYWTGWISKHHRQRRRLLEGSGPLVTAGLLALGFTAVYREGFETVLFLQSLTLEAGAGVVLEGVALGLLATAAVGVATFVLQRKLPYRRMLIATGALICVVLVVMIGGTAATFQALGWLPTTPLPFDIPTWVGAWFEVYPTYETVGAQLLAAMLVVGSYFAAERLLVRRRAAHGQAPARPATAPPSTADEAA